MPRYFHATHKDYVYTLRCMLCTFYQKSFYILGYRKIWVWYVVTILQGMIHLSDTKFFGGCLGDDQVFFRCTETELE